VIGQSGCFCFTAFTSGSVMPSSAKARAGCRIGEETYRQQIQWRQRLESTASLRLKLSQLEQWSCNDILTFSNHRSIDRRSNVTIKLVDNRSHRSEIYISVSKQLECG
jgi:hypothetical protein